MKRLRAALWLLAALTAALAAPAKAGAADDVAAILEGCKQGPGKACVEHLWSFADVVADSRLTAAELSRFFRLVAEVTARRAPSPAQPGDAGAAARAENDRAMAVGAAFLAGPVAAKLVIANYDYDGDGVVSRDELFLDLDEAAFHRLVVEEARRLPERMGSIMMRALEAQQNLGGVTGGGVGGKVE